MPYEDVVKLTQYSHRKAKSLYETMTESSLIVDLSDKARQVIDFVLSLVKKHSTLSRERGVLEVLLAFLQDSGYLKHLTELEDKEQLDLLNQFYKRIKNFEEAALEPSLKNFMEEISFEIEAGEEGKLEFDPEQGPDMIKVMTIHGAKGLEFKYVFLVNMVDKRFPTIERGELIELPDELIKDIKPMGDVHLQEERRICYVAMTRAKKGLFFTSARDYGLTRKKKLSRFLIEMGYQDKAEEKEKRTSNSLSEISADKAKVSQKEDLGKYLPDHFSFSQLAAFAKCPLQYKFGFILKVPIKGKAVFSFGKTMHQTFYDFLKLANESGKNQQPALFESAKVKTENKKNIPLDLKDLNSLYEKNWLDDWYESKAQKEEYYKLGKKILKDFYQEFQKNPPKILRLSDFLALEMPFNLKIGGHKLYGVIDRMDEEKEGVVIIDYKTGKAKEKLAAEDKEQLLIYQIAVEELFKLKPKELVYYYLNDNKKVSFLGSDKEKENLKEKIAERIEAIKKSDFKPTPGWQCNFCDFKDICEFAQK
jgi:DNA helicase-2/ATP-dependent DNA helicase PcrA